MTAAVHSSRESHSDWVRLRTLILLRWMAIFGQIAAIAVAGRFFGMQLPIWGCACWSSVLR